MNSPSKLKESALRAKKSAQRTIESSVKHADVSPEIYEADGQAEKGDDEQN